MIEKIFTQYNQYQLEATLERTLLESDQIFSSNRGIYINRGELFTSNISDIKGLLKEVNDNYETPKIKPFIIFGLSFKNKSSDETKISFPKEAIHIDNRNFVTHYRFSIDENFEETKFVNDSNEYPHQLELTSTEAKENFSDKVSRALKYIENGEVSKVVLARQLKMVSDTAINKRILFLELLDSQPDCYVYSINNFVGASPELLLEKFDDTIKLQPMAGTRKRHARINDDEQDLADLRTNTKDTFEHKVVVEDIVAKLNKISKNVFYPENPSVIKLPHVAHLATNISAIVDKNIDIIDLINIIHPTPAVAGVPTAKALEIIDELEDFDREIYAAPIGWFDSDLNGQSALALRCAKVIKETATLFAGVGIVKGSDPIKEWDETKAKLGVIRDALMNISQ
ncbi:MAG: isochorismate synthase [Acidimicrobiia bacterium]